MDSRADEFVTQAREHLALLEQILLSLEKPGETSEDREEIDRCLRLVHSLKGDAGFLGFSGIRILANVMENVLEALRHAKIAPTPVAIERLLEARDRLSALVDDLEGSHSADLRDILEPLERLERAILQAPHALDLDLREVSRQHSGRLADFFATLKGLGTVVDPSITLGTTDLTLGLPAGPIRFRASLVSLSSPEVVLQSLGMASGKATGRRENSWPLSVDLEAWSRTSGRPLVALLDELARLGDLEGPRLEWDEGDLAEGLPEGPVVLSGLLRTSLDRAELEDRLQLPIPRTPPPPALERPSPRPVDPPPPSPPPVASVPSAGATPRPAMPEADKAASLRISVELLDRLMTLTGELTLIRNQSVLALEQDDGPLRPIMQRLDAVTSALQETVLRTRMQPVGNLFGRFPRVVRDLGRQLGKQVEITIVGRDVELDKTILEQLSDPLTHLVRNSVDHGIERPEDRVANGKPATGQITLTATHEEGQVRIEIRDDGRGIDSQAVRAKALAMRLRTESELDRMSPRELLGLILLPGFSTASQITEVSGRGVGMDVVKTNIEQLEGSLVIDSAPGFGTAMILRMPLTLAIIPCLIVTVNGDRFAIPQRELEEAVCLHPGLPGRIERAYDTEVFRLRDRLLPIVRLRDVLASREPFAERAKAGPLASGTGDADPARIEYILVLRLLGRRFGLVVDDVKGTEEIVVKPLHGSIKRVGLFAGATIMGDGRVALIADVAGIVEHARPNFDAAAESSTKHGDSRQAAQEHRVLLFESGPLEQFALPLLQISRIEMVDRGRIERVGAYEYVNIDGLSMRILRLETVLDVSAPEAAATGPGTQLSLILPKFGQPAMAILVSRIVDTESLAVDLQSHPEQAQGILGSAIVRGRLTLFLDIHRLSQQLFGNAPPAPSTSGTTAAKRPKRLLLIDDTPFFREVVKRYLAAEGHEVDTAINGEDALTKLSTGGEFDLIVSDVEMPVMDGWDFAREARRRGIKTPMLALTSLSGIPYEIKAKECGFDSYEVKLDHDRLVRKVSNLLASRDMLK